MLRGLSSTIILHDNYLVLLKDWFFLQTLIRNAHYLLRIFQNVHSPWNITEPATFETDKGNANTNWPSLQLVTAQSICNEKKDLANRRSIPIHLMSNFAHVEKKKRIALPLLPIFPLLVGVAPRRRSLPRIVFGALGQNPSEATVMESTRGGASRMGEEEEDVKAAHLHIWTLVN